MKHRTSIHTGLGGNSPVLLPNNGRLSKKEERFVYAVMEAYFSKMMKEDGLKFLDWHKGKNFIAVGIEPTYKGDRLRIVGIHRVKGASVKVDGYAFGAYGTQIGERERHYIDYTRKSAKFVKFVDKWHSVLFPEERENYLPRRIFLSVLGVIDILLLFALVYSIFTI